MLRLGTIPSLIAAVCWARAAAAPTSAAFTIEDHWNVLVTSPGVAGETVHVRPSSAVSVTSEKYENVPFFDAKNSGWSKGLRLNGVKTQETTSPGRLEAASVAVRAGLEPEAPLLRRGVDYELDPVWGTFGRLEGGQIKIDQPVFVSYRYSQMRLDSVVLTQAGRIVLRQGQPRVAAPLRPTLEAGERCLGNIYLTGSETELTPENLYPVLETAYPEESAAPKPAITDLTRRLEAGQSLRILAWGDSVTDGVYLSNKDTQRWQEQFVARLQRRFPKARLILTTQAWGGRNTASYLAEPPGSSHNYLETVLAVKPDVIISEFVNDANLKPEQVEERYSKLLADFEGIGAQWIILTPHYVRPDWMGLTQERDIDRDPRPYVEGLRQFAAKHNVPLADASLRYGRLWRQGIPYSTLLVNAINHPNAEGMSIFADALMALFP